jgi:hypothetical protein
MHAPLMHAHAPITHTHIHIHMHAQPCAFCLPLDTPGLSSLFEQATPKKDGKKKAKTPIGQFVAAVSPSRFASPSTPW